MTKSDVPKRRRKSQFPRSPARHGSILILTAVLTTLVFALLAFSVDMGVAYVARTEMQRSADAAAMAGTWDLWDQQARGSDPRTQQLIRSVQQEAAQFAALNPVIGASPGLGNSDVTIGYMADPTDPNAVLVQDAPGTFNGTRVRVRRTSDQNGQIPFFFARVMGFDGLNQQVEATAVYLSNFRGFRAPSNGEPLGILPIALDEISWDELLQGAGNDEWAWDAENETIRPGSDGFLELNLYPQGIGLPGNRGTVDIGSSNNSTTDIKRQILYGLSKSDLAYHGGSLEFDANGELLLNADTGISAAIKTELTQIMGKPVMIPIFSEVYGNGNNADYTCVKFIGVRIMDVRLTGKMKGKRVIIQPSAVTTLGGIPSADESQFTYHIYSPVVLAR